MSTKLTDEADDEEYPPLQPPTRQHSIASRISLDESRKSTPPVPPGFEAHIGTESRRSTPTIPPGLSKPTALPDLERSFSRPSSRPSSRASTRRQTSQIQAVLPLRPATPTRVATPSRPDYKDEARKDLVEETPTKPSRAHASSELKIATSGGEMPPSLDDERHAPTSSEASEVRGISADTSITEEINVPNGFASPEKTETIPAAIQPASKAPATVGASEAKAVPLVSGKTDAPKPEMQKRKHPGKLNITAAVSQQKQTEASISTPVDNVTPSKPERPVSDLSHTPSSARPLDSPNIASPALKTTAPRTLRVVQTPKAETPPPTAASSIPAPFAHRLPSRQPSVASINLPGTPSSEQVSMSDNISMTSTSLSRANSPPPAGSKVGSAPVRVKTKSQQKKDRQERAKVLEEERARSGESSKPSVEEPVVEAIVSRKKKAKKEKDPKPSKAKPAAAPAVTTTNTTPTASRPASPGGKIPAETLATKADILPTEKDSKPATPVKSTSPPIPSANPSPPPTPTLTPAQLIAELKASAPEIQKCIDSLFRVSNSHHFKTQHHISQKDLLAHFKADFKYQPTKEEVDALLKGKIPAVHYGGEDGRVIDRGMVTPSGAHLRALTKELETRFLELEKALREMPEELRFRPSKPQNEVKFEKFDLEALKRQYENGARGASVMEQMVQDGSTMKKGAFLVDEASKYINEFVMPPVTPPPSVASQARVAHGHAVGGGQVQASAQAVPSMDIAERQLNESKRMSDEKENSLKKLIKKNKKTLGLA